MRHQLKTNGGFGALNISPMQKTSTKGRDLAWDIATRLRGNEFKDMTLGEIDDFRAEMAKFLDLKKEW